MTYLWDTHALIFALTASPELPPKVRGIAAAGANAVSCITLWEIALLAHKGRIKLKQPAAEWLEAATRQIPVLPITPAIAARAYELGEFHGDPADRIIAATSLVYPATIVTRDNKLRQHPKLKCLWD